MLLAGKNAVITGCNRGIGKAILEVFAQQGANVWACVRKEDAEFSAFTKDLEITCNVDIIPIYFDLTDSEQMKSAVKSIRKMRRGVDILVNNAGVISDNRLFQMTPVNEMKRLFDVNFFAQIEFTQYISRMMIKQKKGSIIYIASIAGIDGEAQLEYSASKAAVIMAVKNLARELGKYDIRVNAVAPGIVDTEMKVAISIAYLEDVLSRIALHRCADKDEIAKVALFLATDLSSYMTGQVLRVDGGM